MSYVCLFLCIVRMGLSSRTHDSLHAEVGDINAEELRGDDPRLKNTKRLVAATEFFAKESCCAALVAGSVVTSPLDKLMVQIFSMEGAALHWYKLQPPEVQPSLGLVLGDDHGGGDGEGMAEVIGEPVQEEPVQEDRAPGQPQPLNRESLKWSLLFSFAQPFGMLHQCQQGFVRLLQEKSKAFEHCKRVPGMTPRLFRAAILQCSAALYWRVQDLFTRYPFKFLLMLDPEQLEAIINDFAGKCLCCLDYAFSRRVKVQVMSQPDFLRSKAWLDALLAWAVDSPQCSIILDELLHASMKRLLLESQGRHTHARHKFIAEFVKRWLHTKHFKERTVDARGRVVKKKKGRSARIKKEDRRPLAIIGNKSKKALTRQAAMRVLPAKLQYVNGKVAEHQATLPPKTKLTFNDRAELMQGFANSFEALPPEVQMHRQAVSEMQQEAKRCAQQLAKQRAAVVPSFEGSLFDLGDAYRPLSAERFAGERRGRGIRKMEDDIIAADEASGSMRSLCCLSCPDVTPTLLQGVKVDDVSQDRKQRKSCPEKHNGLCETAHHKVIDECKRVAGRLRQMLRQWHALDKSSLGEHCIALSEKVGSPRSYYVVSDALQRPSYEVFTEMRPSYHLAGPTMPCKVVLDVSSGVLEHCPTYALAERIVSKRTMIVEHVVYEDISLTEIMAVAVEASWDLTKPVPRASKKEATDSSAALLATAKLKHRNTSSCYVAKKSMRRVTAKSRPKDVDGEGDEDEDENESSEDLEDPGSEQSQIFESDPDTKAADGIGVKGRRKAAKAKAKPKAKRKLRMPPAPCASELNIKPDAQGRVFYPPFSSTKPLGILSSWASSFDGKQMFSISCKCHTKCSRAVGEKNYGDGSKLVQWLLDGVTLAGDPRLDSGADHKGCLRG